MPAADTVASTDLVARVLRVLREELTPWEYRRVVVSHIAARAGVHRATAGYTLNELVRLGLLERGPRGLTFRLEAQHSAHEATFRA